MRRLLFIGVPAIALLALAVASTWTSSRVRDDAASAQPVRAVARAAEAVPDAPVAPTPAADLARAKELDALSRKGTPAAVEALANAASDPRLGGRAAAALGAVHDPAAAQALAKLAQGNGPALVRANAVLALAASGSHAQAPVLIGLLSDAGQPLRVRVESALTLGALRDDTAVPALSRVLGDPSLRLAAAQSLAGIGTPAARRALAAR